MANYSDYVSFGVPHDIPDVVRNGSENAVDYVMTQDTVNRVHQALTEIASTPEGLAALRAAAANTASGKIHIVESRDEVSQDYVRTGVYGGNRGIIVISDSDDRAKYRDYEQGGCHNLSIQRMLYHELQHVGDPSLGRLRGDENDIGISPSKESDAITATNDFMSKYYGEAPRGGHTACSGFLSRGSSGWDLNRNFDPIGRQGASLDLSDQEGGVMHAALEDGDGVVFDAAAGDASLIAEVQSAGIVNMDASIVPAQVNTMSFDNTIGSPKTSI